MDYTARRSESESESTVERVKAVLESAGITLLLTLDYADDPNLDITFPDYSRKLDVGLSSNITRVKAVLRVALEHLARQNVTRAIRRANKLRAAFGMDPIPDDVEAERGGDLWAWGRTLDEPGESTGPGVDIPRGFTLDESDIERDRPDVTVSTESIEIEASKSRSGRNSLEYEIRATCDTGHLATVDTWQESRILAAALLWAIPNDHVEQIIDDFNSV